MVRASIRIWRALSNRPDRRTRSSSVDLGRAARTPTRLCMRAFIGSTGHYVALSRQYLEYGIGDAGE